MNVDDLRKMDEVYVCNQCARAFLFKDDIEEHKKETGHVEIFYASLDNLR